VEDKVSYYAVVLLLFFALTFVGIISLLPSHVSRISFLHRAVCFEITLYLLSHFSYSSAAFRKIAQASGEGPAGELLCHVVVVVVVVVVVLIFDIFHLKIFLSYISF
jgi:hypothetical protein